MQSNWTFVSSISIDGVCISDGKWSSALRLVLLNCKAISSIWDVTKLRTWHVTHYFMRYGARDVHLVKRQQFWVLGASSSTLKSKLWGTRVLPLSRQIKRALRWKLPQQLPSIYPDCIEWCSFYFCYGNSTAEPFVLVAVFKMCLLGPMFCRAHRV